MRTYLFLSIGAILGAICRFQVGMALSSGNGALPGFPWGTFLINVSGSLLLGFLSRWLLGTSASPDLRIMLTTGFCGAYTTFSTFSYEMISLFNNGQPGVAIAYMAASMATAPLACLGGYLLAGRAL